MSIQFFSPFKIFLSAVLLLSLVTSAHASKRIYVGNLPYSMTTEQLTSLFAKYGEVSSANIIVDRDTGKTRGFGFVEMPVATEADSAIQALHQTQQDGRSINVNEARPSTDRSRDVRERRPLSQ